MVFNNFNPRSPCGERLSPGSIADTFHRISIHALLAESDGRCCKRAVFQPDFNPRSPCGERLGILPDFHSPGDFNPRSPCGERPATLSDTAGLMIFQSTLSLRRATLSRAQAPPFPREFQSTLSLRRATAGTRTGRKEHPDFNPRSPCGERHFIQGCCEYMAIISIHALLAESDFRPSRIDSAYSNFNPRSPCGERRRRWCPRPGGGYFNPRSPCGERPASRVLRPLSMADFNPRSPCGERPQPVRRCCFRIPHFNPRSPCGERPLSGGANPQPGHNFNPRSPCGERLK